MLELNSSFIFPYFSVSAMKVLIVESEYELGLVWRRALERFGVKVVLVADQSTAVQALQNQHFDLIVLDLVLENGSPFTISDFANYRRPAAQVMFVTNTSFFSDGSIFKHCSNACAYVQSATPPEDIAMMVIHYAARV